MRLCVALCSVVFAAALSAPVAGAVVETGASSSEDTTAAKAASWIDLEKQISEGRLEEASGTAARLLAQARAAGLEEDQARALVRGAQIRRALHGIPEALRSLRAETWPAGAVSRSVLDLFVAHSLAAYVRVNDMEISQRERVESKDAFAAFNAFDIEHWTRQQIGEAIVASYRAVWNRRQELGEVPVARWAEYLQSDGEAVEIRQTLRDSVSSLFAEQLADSSFWQPDQSEEIYRLDLPALIRGEVGVGDEALDRAGAHPLVKVAAVLADLEAWHLAAYHTATTDSINHHRAAALEAHWERLRRLHAAFTAEADRRQIRADLKASLLTARDLPWWSMGMATLASFERESGEGPGQAERAHATAVAGAAAFPGSPGAVRCSSIIGEIESRDYQLYGMAADGPGQRSIQVIHTNLPALYFRAFAVDPRGQAEREARSGHRLGDDELKSLLRDSRPVAAWRADLPPTPDFAAHTTWIVPPLDRPGVYLVLASPREDFALADNRIEGLSFVLGDLVLAVRDRAPAEGIDVLALSGVTGEPVAGAAIRLFLLPRNPSGGSPREEMAMSAMSATSGADGSVHFAVAAGGGAGYFLLATKGEDVAMVTGQNHWSAERSEEVRSTLLYTDRAVYRPQQKILWKVLAYTGRPREGRFATAVGEAVTVTLYDPNQQKVAEQTVATNERGTASGELLIPPGHPLGGWRLESRGEGSGSRKGGAPVQVEEYKRPTFEASLDEPAAPLRLNRPAQLKGRAVYYFGLPVTRGKVRWRVTREPYFPSGWWRRGGNGPRSGVIATGTASLSPEGAFEVAFTPQGDERLGAEVTYGFTIAAEVTDEGGETRSAETRVRLGLVSLEARIAGDPAFLRAGRKASLAIVRSDLNGVPRSGAGAWSLYELRQPERALLPAEQPQLLEDGYHTPGDSLSPRWNGETGPERILAGWSEGRKVASGTLRHGASGQADVPLPALRPAAYRLRYETLDDFGRRVEARRELIVAGRRTPLALPAVLAVETPTVRVGGTARLLVHSGLPGQALFFEIDRDGEPIEKRMLRAGTDSSLIEIPIRAADRGGLGFRLLVLRDHQILDLAASVQVPWDDRELKVRFATFRDTIRPGARETWRVTVEDATAPVAAAELLASMTDRSLDAFAGYLPPSPLSLYPNRARTPQVGASLGWQRPLWLPQGTWRRAVALPPPRPDFLRFFDDLGLPGVPWRRVAFGEITMTGDRAAQSLLVTEGAFFDERWVSSGAARVYYDFDAFEELERIPTARDPWALLAAFATAVPVRSDFRETALWQPHLLTGPDGSAAIELTVPDSVTAWSVWVHAITRDLRAGSVHRETRSAKELLVRPSLPRFLREGDRAEVKVVVTTSGTRPLDGEVVLDILDPDTETSLLAEMGLAPGAARLPFHVAAGGTASVTFPLNAPRRVGPVAFKVTAVAGDLSDGELRSLPILPSRVHLAQSRFAMLHGSETRTLRFADLEKDDDPTRRNEQLVVTVDGQLFDGVLAALPYLVDDPYECTEQTLNRFLSTGIVTSLFDQYPAVAKRAAELAKRDTRLETWDAEDPNRKLALEETPFLETSQGGGMEKLNKVLDPRIARAERDVALAKLAQAQLPSGAFPWWPGGPASPYMTVYLLDGLAKATEFGIAVPPEMVHKAWKYLAGVRQETGGWEILTYLSFVATAYPDPSWLDGAFPPEERKRLLDASFAHRFELSRHVQGLLALALKRTGRIDDARLVFDTVMNTARTTRDEGTFWQPEDSPWLWSRDTIESHALMLRTLLELHPDDPRRHGLVQWLFLHKQLNHWQSTRATAEVLYSLVRYLKAEGQLGTGQAATVRVGEQTTRFVFEPEGAAGKESRIVVPGKAIEPARSAVEVEQETPGFLYAAATWHFSTEAPPRAGDGDLFQVSRRYFLRAGQGTETVLRPLAADTVLKPGDEVEVQLTVHNRLPAEYVHLRDPRPAGLEPGIVLSGWKWDLGIQWYEETRDSAASFFIENLPAGEHTFKVRLRANVAGTFRVGPATVQSMYAPEFNAYSAADVVRIGE